MAAGRSSKHARGVRYLIAAFMVGCLFAWLHYRASMKRVVFVCLALAVALVSNWLRAYAIVLLGHLSNNRLGTGVDHNLLGWLIFGAAMFGVFVIGMRWSDKERHCDLRSPAQRGRAQPVSIQAIVAVLRRKPADGCSVARHGSVDRISS